MDEKDEYRVAIYCRVSTAEQTTENQRLTLEKYAREKGWIYDIYEEVESSRKTRPVKQHLLAKLRAGDYDAVLVFKLDRFARSTQELIMDVNDIIKQGKGFYSVADNLDFSTASGRLHFQILSAFAEFEREIIRERTLEGLKRAMKQGKSPGRPKGSKDKKKRRRSGYIMREAFKRKKVDESKGEYRNIETYLP